MTKTAINRSNIEKAALACDLWDQVKPLLAQLDVRDEEVAGMREEIALQRRFKNELQEEVKRLRDALERTALVVKDWHGPEAWEIYRDHSPEMKPYREAVGRPATLKDK